MAGLKLFWVLSTLLASLSRGPTRRPLIDGGRGWPGSNMGLDDLCDIFLCLLVRRSVSKVFAGQEGSATTPVKANRVSLPILLAIFPERFLYYFSPLYLIKTMPYTYTDIATRALVVTLKAPNGGAKTTAQIHLITGLPERTINQIYSRAIDRGFEPNESPL